MEKYDSRFKKKLFKQILLLTIPLLLIIAAYAVFVYALDIDGKINSIECEIYGDIYSGEENSI